VQGIFDLTRYIILILICCKIWERYISRWGEEEWGMLLSHAKMCIQAKFTYLCSSKIFLAQTLRRTEKIKSLHAAIVPQVWHQPKRPKLGLRYGLVPTSYNTAAYLVASGPVRWHTIICLSLKYCLTDTLRVPWITNVYPKFYNVFLVLIAEILVITNI